MALDVSVIRLSSIWAQEPGYSHHTLTMKLHSLAIILALAAFPDSSLAAPRDQMLQRQAHAFGEHNKVDNSDHHDIFHRRQTETYKPEMDKKEYDEFTRDYGVGGWCRDYDHGKGSDAVEGYEMCIDYCKKENPNPELVNGQRPSPNCGMAFIPTENVKAYEAEIRTYVDHQGYKWRQLPCDCDMADVAKAVSTFANIILPALGQGLCGLMEELYEGTMKALDIGLTIVDIASTVIPGPGTLVKIGSKALQIGVKAAKTLDKASSAGDKASSALEFANWFGGGCGKEQQKANSQNIQEKFFPALLKVPDEIAGPCGKGKCRDSDKDGNPDFPDGTPEHLPNPPDNAKKSTKPADKPKTMAAASSKTIKPASAANASTTEKVDNASTNATSKATMQPTTTPSGYSTIKPASGMTTPSITKSTSTRHGAQSITPRTTTTSAAEEEEEEPLVIPVPHSLNATIWLPTRMYTTTLTGASTTLTR